MKEVEQNKTEETKLESQKVLLMKQKQIASKIGMLKKNVFVQEYIELSKQYDEIDKELDILQENFKKECANNGHNEVLFFIGYEKDRCENEEYMMATCLNCGVTITIPNIDMEQNLILDGKKYCPEYLPLLSKQLMDEYHRLQECYEENPDILKETAKSKKMIYKVMKRRCEENAND